MTIHLNSLIKFSRLERDIFGTVTKYGNREDIRVHLEGPAGRIDDVRAIVFNDSGVPQDALDLMEKRTYTRLEATDSTTGKIHTVFINNNSFKKSGSAKGDTVDSFLARQARLVPRFQLARQTQQARADQVIFFLRNGLGYKGSVDDLSRAIDIDTINTLAEFCPLVGFAKLRANDAFKAVHPKLGTLQVAGNTLILSNKSNLPYLFIELDHITGKLVTRFPILGILSKEEQDIFQELVTDTRWIRENRTYVEFGDRGGFGRVVSVIDNSVYITTFDPDTSLGQGGNAAYAPCQRITVNPDLTLDRTTVAHGIDTAAIGVRAEARTDGAIDYIVQTDRLYQKMKGLTKQWPQGLCRVCAANRQPISANDGLNLGISIYQELLETRLDTCFDENAVKAADFCVEPRVLEHKRKYALDLLTGLNILHVLGLVHRDVKFGNIMFPKDFSEAKLIDYGEMVAKPDIQGTPSYLPEAFLQQHKVYGTYIPKKGPFSIEDYKRADLFAMGLILLFLEEPATYQEFVQAKRLLPAFTYLDKWLDLPTVKESPMFKVIEGLLVKNFSSARSMRLMKQSFPELVKKEAPRFVRFMEEDEAASPAGPVVDTMRFEEKEKKVK